MAVVLLLLLGLSCKPSEPVSPSIGSHETKFFLALQEVLLQSAAAPWPRLLTEDTRPSPVTRPAFLLRPIAPFLPPSPHSSFPSLLISFLVAVITFLTLLICPYPGFPYEKVVQRVLYLQVLDYDRFSRNDPIGEVSIPLNKVDLTQMQTFWKDLKPCSDGSVRPPSVL